MKNFIKIVSIVLITIAICLSFNMKNITGFFCDKESIPNKIAIGDVETEIIEEIDTKIIVAGEQFKKVVKIKNIGQSPCFVRTKVLISPENYKNELDLDINTNDWEYKDGYYYYKNVLQINDETTPLFTELTIPSSLEKGDIFDVNIYSESIQSFAYNKDNTISQNYIDIFKSL